MVASLVHRLETELQGVRSWCGTTLGYGRTRICTQTVRLGPGRDSSPSLGAGLHGSSPHLPAPFLLHTHPRPFAHTTLLLEARWAARPQGPDKLGCRLGKRDTAFSPAVTQWQGRPSSLSALSEAGRIEETGRRGCQGSGKVTSRLAFVWACASSGHHRRGPRGRGGGRQWPSSSLFCPAFTVSPF